MDEIHRFLKKQGQRARKAADPIAQRMSDGVQALKQNLDAASRNSGNSLGLQQELRALYKKQADLEGLYQQSRSMLISCKQLETTNELKAKLDAAVFHRYYREGGIRFHLYALLEQTDWLDPAEDPVDRMVVHCYNSAIAYCLQEIEPLEQECRDIAAQLEGVKTLYQDDASLRRALGFTPCLGHIQAAKAKDLPEAVSALQDLVSGNAQALGRYLGKSAVPRSPRSLNYMGLLNDLRRLLDPNTLRQFSSPEGWTPERYAEAVCAYAGRVKTELIDRYPLPEETEKAEDRQEFLRRKPAP